MGTGRRSRWSSPSVLAVQHRCESLEPLDRPALAATVEGQAPETLGQQMLRRHPPDLAVIGPYGGDQFVRSGIDEIDGRYARMPHPAGGTAIVDQDQGAITSRTTDRGDQISDCPLKTV